MFSPDRHVEEELNRSSESLGLAKCPAHPSPASSGEGAANLHTAWGQVEEGCETFSRRAGCVCLCLCDVVSVLSMVPSRNRRAGERAWETGDPFREALLP